MVGSVEDEPYCEIDLWGVMQDFSGFRFVGRDLATRAARVSSRIVSWDGRERTATTVSGRFYRLVGEPNPRVTRNLVRAHINKWRLRPDDAVVVNPEEIVDLLGEILR